MSALTALVRFARPGGPGPAAGERCELCGAPIGEPHRHVADLERRSVRCACATCARLFALQGAGGGRLRTVPDRVLEDPSFELSDAEWRALEIPVRLAFVFFSSAAERWIAMYPSPAGATESELPLDAWRRISARGRLAASAEPDVEALLVRGPRGGGPLQCLLAPIDACYELVGRIRRTWRGFDGGDEARREIDAFFEALRRRARTVPGLAGAER
jgi:hypothetical protein